MPDLRYLSLRLTPEEHARLSALAQVRGESLNSLARKALECYFKAANREERKRAEEIARLTLG